MMMKNGGYIHVHWNLQIFASDINILRPHMLSWCRGTRSR